MITGHGGDIFDAARICGCEPSDIVDMSSNMNPLGTPPELLDHLRGNLDVLTRLPQADARRAGDGLARSLDLDPRMLALGSGTTQFIYAAPAALDIQRALIAVPTYADYADACRVNGVDFETCSLKAEDDFAFEVSRWEPFCGRCDTVFFCNPNNPTGRLVPAAVLEALCRRYPRTRFIVDESYLPLCPGGERESLLHRPSANRIVLRSLSKTYCIPGLRIGFLVGDPHVVERFSRRLPPWSVNGLAQCAVEYLTGNRIALQRFVEQTRRYLAEEIPKVVRRLQGRTALDPIPSQTVFVLARLPEPWSAEALKSRLLADRILIRNCSNFEGLNHRYVRFSLKDQSANRELIQRLADCCSPASGRRLS